MPKTKHSKTKPSDKRQTVLLTGFGPFPGVAENVSACLVMALVEKARAAFPNVKFEVSVLPTEWQAGPDQLAMLIAKSKPTLVLLFGITKDARGFRIETQGVNLCRNAADAAGLQPLAPVLIHEAASAYPATLPVAAIVQRLKLAGLPVAVSDNAGAYLCNAALYHALHAAGSARHPSRVGFIHIPDSLSRPPLTFDQALQGGLEIIRASLEGAQV
jgi:pyroglutamyl-peptidase